ncbi:Alkaline phosphatase synthesis sensor protein PhoR [compost metagenome]
MLPDPVPECPTSRWRFLGPAIAAGLLGLAINAWLAVPLYERVHLFFGSVPVLMVALLFGWRGGLVSASIAGLGTYWVLGEPVPWVVFALEAMLVGALASRLHPAATVAAFWLLLGLPAYWLAARVDPAGFGTGLSAVAFKTPTQELFAALLAQTLLFLSPLRVWAGRSWPGVRLPRVSLLSFQLTFLALVMLTVSGAMLLAEGRALYEHERRTLERFNKASAVAAGARLESLFGGYNAALVALAGQGTDRAGRERAAARLLGPDRFQRLGWVNRDAVLTDGWAWSAENGLTRLGSAPSVARLLEIPPGPDGVRRMVVPSPMAGGRPLLMMVVPANGGGYVLAAVEAGAVEGRLLNTSILSESVIVVQDGDGRPLLRAETLGPARRLQHAIFPWVPAAGADLISEAAVPTLGWHVRVETPEWVVRERVDLALRQGLPWLLPILLVLAALGASLMAVLGQEFKQLRFAAHRLGHVEHALPGFPDTALLDVESLYQTFAKVSASLRRTMTALRTREAELTIANSQLGATVDELHAMERSRGEVLNAISHDIKIPLTAIVGYTELLEEEAAGKLTGDQREFVQGIDENSRRVIRLLEDLLDLTRLEVGRFPIDAQALDIAEALASTRRTLQPLIDRKGLTMVVEVDGDLPLLLADPARVDQVLNNLVSNAIKFTPAGGHLALRAYPAPDGGGAVVQVIDDGPGIAPEHLAHLFERFYRVPGSAAGGTGLGLAISKGLVEAMNGTIGVISEPGRGTTFWFTLPFAASVRPAGAVTGEPRA